MVVHTKKPNVITANKPLDEFSNAVNILMIAGDDCTNFLSGRMIRVIRRIMKGKTPLTPHAAITDKEVTKKSKQFMNDDRYANKPFATVSMKNSATKMNMQTRWMNHNSSRWGPHRSAGNAGSQLVISDISPLL